MAKTKTTGTKKLSRREMVVLLGSGAFVTAKGEPAEAQAGTCRTVSPNRGTGKSKNLILSGDPCCKDSLAVFLKGMGMSVNLSGTAKANLKPLADALKASEHDLLEYSVMLWGLKQDERDAIMKVYEERYSFKPYKAG
jgi:hypothetical protein